MSNSIITLELQRSAILTRILDLGDFRSGSITAISGRCGKPNCRCHQPDQPGHGPNYRLTRKVKGKTVSESFSSPVVLRKAEREVEAFHLFRELSRQLLEVNEKICQARPVEESLPLQGGAAAIQQVVTVEIDRLLKVLCAGQRQTGSLDLEGLPTSRFSAYRMKNHDPGNFEPQTLSRLSRRAFDTGTASSGSTLHSKAK